MEDGKLTLEGFMRLNEMEAEDADNDPDDVWVTLLAFGYNRSLKQDEVEILLYSGLIDHY